MVGGGRGVEEPERATTERAAPPGVRVAVRVRADGADTVAPSNVRLPGPNGATFRAQAGADEGDFVIRRSLRVPLMRLTPCPLSTSPSPPYRTISRIPSRVCT